MTQQQPDDHSPQTPIEADLASAPLSFPEIRPLPEGQQPKQRVDYGAIGIMIAVGIVILAVGTYLGVPAGALRSGIMLLFALTLLGLKLK